MRYATHLDKTRKFSNGYYYPFVDFYLDPYMLPAERTNMQQDMEYYEKLFKDNKIRHRFAKIKKYFHQYVRLYVHEDDIYKAKRLDGRNLDGY